MRHLFCCTLFFLFSFALFSQSKNFIITGKIVDDKTSQALPGASVFCQNTTMGTISDNDGKFYMRLNNGGYDLVVSYTGYETKLIRISNGNKENDSMTIALKAEDKSMAEVVVAGSAEVADGWTKYGQFFMDNFIGTTPNSADCSIQNKDAIKFYFYKKRNKLKVKSKENIIVMNTALGYRIKYQLDSFVYDYNNNIGSYTGYPLFEELGDSATPEQRAIWKKNRFRSYIGSRLHFMRSWYDSTLTDEGYQIELLDSSDNNKSTVLDDPYDSRYYSVDSGDAVINIRGRIRVNYKNQVPDKKYLAQNHFPSTAKKQISALDIASDGFVIEENGYFYEQADVINMGYWAWKKLAELLPYDYDPD
jgi:hypothetical protein